MADPVSIAFDLPFESAIAAANGRGLMLPDAYYRQAQAAMRRASTTVSGLAGMDQIQQVIDSLNDALASGEALSGWQKRVQSESWGLPKARLETVFRTNVQTAYSFGHWQSFRENEANRGYLMWSAINDSRVRPTHLAMDGYIAPINDEIWRVWHPPAGYRCRCHQIALTKEQAIARGYGKQARPDSTVRPDPGFADVDPDSVTDGVAKAVEYRQSQCGLYSFAGTRRMQAPEWCHGIGAKEMARLKAIVEAGEDMPDARSGMHIPKIIQRLTAPEYFAAFMGEFGGGSTQEYASVIPGYDLLVDDDLFKTKNGDWKIAKGGRAPWLMFVAANIKDPDEIWLDDARNGGPDRMYLLSRYDVRAKNPLSVLTAFDRARGGLWSGVTGYGTLTKDYAEDNRGGVLVYRRSDR